MNNSLEEDLKPLYTSYLEEELYLRSDGVWHHNGSAFTHKKLSLLFHRSIQWDNELKKHTLRIGLGRATFKHDGYVQFVSSLTERDGEVFVKLLDESEKVLDFTKLRIATDGVFLLINQDTPLPARFLRTAQQLLLAYANSENELSFKDKTYTIESYVNE